METTATPAIAAASYDVSLQGGMPMNMTMILLIPIVGAVALFAFLSVAAWADQRRKEREAFYRSELLKKLADSTGGQAQEILAILREQDREAERKSREGMKLGGLITTVVGAALMIMFHFLTDGPEWAVGLVPVFVGAALLFYAYVLAPRSAEPQGQ
jgi:peptidoglycan/LPS O-acetylase OafA/YrhL